MRGSTIVRVAPPRPPMVAAAFWAYIVVAAANVAVGIWTLSFVPAVAAAYQREGKAVPEQAIVLSIVSIGLATLLFSGALVLFAIRLRAGSTWARPILLTVSILSLAALFTGGGPGLIVVALSVVAGLLVTRAPVSAWLRSARGLPPA